ncbi:MAG TPA: hypothetical protein VGI48_09510 [Caldimonas sp.]|jgi:hypothetical protein
MSDEVLTLPVLPDIYRAGREHLFPSTESLNWFIKRNRAELVSAGALTLPTGRWMVQPDAFDRVVLAIGARRASK